MNWFWLFLFYSFGGYLLEKAFAYATAAPLQVRKCLLLLPLCPVYGLGMLVLYVVTGMRLYAVPGMTCLTMAVMCRTRRGGAEAL